MHSMRALGVLSGLVSADISLGGCCQSPGSLGDGPSPLAQSFTFTSFLAPNSQLGYGVGAPTQLRGILSLAWQGFSLSCTVSAILVGRGVALTHQANSQSSDGRQREMLVDFGLRMTPKA